MAEAGHPHLPLGDDNPLPVADPVLKQAVRAKLKSRRDDSQISIAVEKKKKRMSDRSRESSDERVEITSEGSGDYVNVREKCESGEFCGNVMEKAGRYVDAIIISALFAIFLILLSSFIILCCLLHQVLIIKRQNNE